MEGLKPGDPLWLGPFRLLGRLGSGELGRLFLGQRMDGVQAAVKLVHDRFARDARFGARFADDVAAARAVRAPWTAPVLDAEPRCPQPWLATAYVPGPTVDEVVDAGGPLPEPHVRVLAARMAEALAALHAAGVVHRAVTPTNVLLSADGPVLTDYGVAQDTDSDETMPSDVFSLAAVILYAATGRGPFAGVTDVGADLERLPADLRDVLGPCFATRAADRPTARDLAAALIPDASASPVAPGAPPPAPDHGTDPDRTVTVPPPDTSADVTQEVRTQQIGPVRPAGPGRNPRLRWLVGAAAAAVVVALVVLGVHLLSGHDTVDELAEAIDEGVGPNPTGKTTLTYRSEGPYAASGGGTGSFRVDATGRSAAFRTQSETGGLATEGVILPGRIFLKGTSGGPRPPDKPWIEITPETTGTNAIYRTSTGRQVDDWINPVRSMAELGDAVSVAEARDDLVDGVEARRYVLKTDLAKAAEIVTDTARKQRYLTLVESGQKEDTLTLWLDERDRPLRMRAERSFGPERSARFVSEIRWSDWGAPVDIAAPPADQVAPG